MAWFGLLCQPLRMVAAELLADLLDRQGGIVTLTQLRVYGVDADRAERRVTARRWQRVGRGVYATFTGPLPPRSRVWTALLRVGPGAVASHETAAALDGLGALDARLVHGTVPAARRVRGLDDAIRLHRCRNVHERVRRAASPPRTRIEHTIIDLTDAAATERQVLGWVTSAIERRLTTSDRLLEVAQERGRMRRRPFLMAVLAATRAGVRSPLEHRHLTHVQVPHGLPAGQRQQRVAGDRVIWVDLDLAEFHVRVERDGRLGHAGDGRFRDRRRDNRAAVDGHVTLRYGHTEIFADPCGVAAEMAIVLRSRGWTGRPRRCGPDCTLDQALVEPRCGA